MKYSKLSDGREVSLLGFGCMRFPTRKDGKIARREAKKLLDMAIDGGVNYFDTAYFYHSGESESFTREALAGRDRGSYLLTSKLPTVLVHSLEDAKRIFAEQQKRLGGDCLDFYLFHNMNLARFRECEANGVLDWYLDLQRRGLFRRTGFSFHGSYEDFEEIMYARHWEACQLQLNYMDKDNQAGLRGCALAEKLGVPLIVMEPVKGGALASPPTEVTELFAALNPDVSSASWAVRWAASLPNVLTVLSGMTTRAQVTDNLKTLGDFRPLSKQEQGVVAEAAERFKKRMFNGCTACKYCMPCPAGVDIPGSFALWNRYGMFGQAKDAARRWGETDEKTMPKHCIQCGKCETVCPQELPIRADLKRVQETMDGLGRTQSV